MRCWHCSVTTIVSWLWRRHWVRCLLMQCAKLCVHFSMPVRLSPTLSSRTLVQLIFCYYICSVAAFSDLIVSCNLCYNYILFLPSALLSFNECVSWQFGFMINNIAFTFTLCIYMYTFDETNLFVDINKQMWLLRCHSYIYCMEWHQCWWAVWVVSDTNLCQVIKSYVKCQVDDDCSSYVSCLIKLQLSRHTFVSWRDIKTPRTCSTHRDITRGKCQLLYWMALYNLTVLMCHSHGHTHCVS